MVEIYKVQFVGNVKNLLFFFYTELRKLFILKTTRGKVIVYNGYFSKLSS